MILEASNDNSSYISEYLKSGKVCVLPTDTLYGFSCVALNNTAVEEVYNIKQRESDKPFIILISDILDLHIFGIVLNDKETNSLKKVWPGKVTVVLNCDNTKFEYLHRGKKTLGFRLPDYPWLTDIISRTGPIVSTTVNISGEPPIKDVNSAEDKFWEDVDLFADADTLEATPSTVVTFEGDTVKILRKGDININNLDLNAQIN
jgi:L-threonylcarbamoyladenylate synthase